MRVISADELGPVLDYASLVEHIREMFAIECTVPVRHHHSIVLEDQPEATLLLMPAWRAGAFIGVKVASIFPGNVARGLPSVNATYMVLDGETGAPLALIDGAELTARRTGSASALASRYLSRADSAHHLMIGTGTLAPHLIRAHAAVRPIETVSIWGRTPEKAERLAESMAGESFAARAVQSLEDGVGEADIITCATLSTEPLVLGKWLRPGQHVDLVGAYRPDMRESDDEAVRRARVFVDTRGGALIEGGDVVMPINDGVISAEDIQGDLFDLVRGASAGREGAEEITLFKSVGAAAEDLAAASLALQRT
ncbi:MAG: ornithine cyclodeaminase family protein [Rhodospirillales bacterium]|jgi:ornithine cyclodeaminase|nr:ornithine cyclodeaminase family protein [Rhodospirillales bacterium]MDP6803734.1 ornithine cyclodeaminase family protein [Rhodospirillales bacterium]